MEGRVDIIKKKSMSAAEEEVAREQFAVLNDCQVHGPHVLISGYRGEHLMVTVEGLPVILRKPGNQQKCQK